MLDAVKKSALLFRDRLEAVMGEKGKAISRLRIKVIAFRDFGDYADDAIEETASSSSPTRPRVRDFVSGLDADGGGDVPESGLEALALAINADWETGAGPPAPRDRRVHRRAGPSPRDPAARAAHTYPAGLPTGADQLLEEWGYARSQGAHGDSAKRLVLFAPDVTPWQDIAEEWNMTIHFPSVAGQGLEEFEMGEIINTIANSL